ncbi:hypothetical protein CDAR_17561 [Caerostris darwini]|uniref:Uncharacterized protein n=1 Tax=Caerostris darwini TaxID=1538125 RepID=A0AAV4NA97_9ARAC|nr:hypothetical protein CDAR_17561 [Caerostris darwini]
MKLILIFIKITKYPPDRPNLIPNLSKRGGITCRFNENTMTVETHPSPTAVAINVSESTKWACCAAMPQLNLRRSSPIVSSRCHEYFDAFQGGDS